MDVEVNDEHPTQPVSMLTQRDIRGDGNVVEDAEALPPVVKRVVRTTRNMPCDGRAAIEHGSRGSDSTSGRRK